VERDCPEQRNVTRPPPVPTTIDKVRIGTLRRPSGPLLVALRGDRLLDLAAGDPALPRTARELLGSDGWQSAAERAAESAPQVAWEPEQLLPPIPDPGKVLCIGRNYAAHAEELGHTTVDERPEVFVRTRTSLASPYQGIARPRVSEQLDYEVELAVVIGRRGRHVAASEAMPLVAGYCVFNDVSVRDYQVTREQWTAGKNFDGTGPFGPFLVTADEVEDPHDLELSTTVLLAGGGEEELQRARTSLLVHRIPELIAYITEWATLEPGDVIATGTPPGVGLGRRPPRWLRPGETLVSRIEGLGELRNPVVAETA
jgi:2-keto-4-pentenoate hydratase/2-oxohepta-3-ene-1,7-dioic acid hydratase in catechol pathway